MSLYIYMYIYIYIISTCTFSHWFVPWTHMQINNGPKKTSFLWVYISSVSYKSVPTILLGLYMTKWTQKKTVQMISISSYERHVFTQKDRHISTDFHRGVNPQNPKHPVHGFSTMVNGVVHPLQGVAPVRNR